ncbi:hypothetical protein CDAR_227261 [Caerostris darwini]|uniref:Uncharacterized protein n=1 Tax=Caerostris darwini TaxID=1538125 RepID=A0AAV4UMX1_9ARAC|nr:hypothetical protein CDAR_227261 [Caerostris darwini]
MYHVMRGHGGGGARNEIEVDSFSTFLFGSFPKSAIAWELEDCGEVSLRPLRPKRGGPQKGWCGYVAAFLPLQIINSNDGPFRPLQTVIGKPSNLNHIV